jgi:hypothetical protein
MSLKSLLMIAFITTSMALNIQVKALKSKPTDLSMKRTRETVQDTQHQDEIKSIKLAVKLYVYYSDLLEEDMFNSQSQRKQAQFNFKMIQGKLSKFMDKYRSNKFMISQALQEFQKLKNSNKSQLENTVQPQTFNDEKKPFMWG